MVSISVSRVRSIGLAGSPGYLQRSSTRLRLELWFRVDLSGTITSCPAFKVQIVGRFEIKVGFRSVVSLRPGHGEC